MGRFFKKLAKFADKVENVVKDLDNQQNDDGKSARDVFEEQKRKQRS